MKKIQTLLLLLSLLLGLIGTALFPGTLPASVPVGTSQLAWWGGIYPEYCLPSACELVEGEEPEEGQEIPVKLSFKYLTFLNGYTTNMQRKEVKCRP